MAVLFELTQNLLTKVCRFTRGESWSCECHVTGGGICGWHLVW